MISDFDVAISSVESGNYVELTFSMPISSTMLQEIKALSQTYGGISVHRIDGEVKTGYRIRYDSEFWSALKVMQLCFDLAIRHHFYEERIKVKGSYRVKDKVVQPTDDW